MITLLSSSSFEFPDASHSPLPPEKQVVAFRSTRPSARLLPVLASLEHASYFTYSVPGLFPDHSQKSVNAGAMTVKNTESSWIWKNREQVTTTFHQFDLCSFNALDFLQVSAFLLRTLVPGPLAHPSWDVAARAQGQLRDSCGWPHPCWRWAEAPGQHPDSCLGNNPKQLQWVPVWWGSYLLNKKKRQLLKSWIVSRNSEMCLTPERKCTFLVIRNNGEWVKPQLIHYQDDFTVEVSLNKYLPAVLFFPLKGCISMETMKPGSPVL